MTASRAASLVSHVEYAPRALLTLGKKMGQTDRQTDRRQTITLTLTARGGQLNKSVCSESQRSLVGLALSLNSLTLVVSEVLSLD